MPPILQGLKDARIWVLFYVDEEGKIIDKNIILDDENARENDYFIKDLEKILPKTLISLIHKQLVAMIKKRLNALIILGYKLIKQKNMKEP